MSFYHCDWGTKSEMAFLKNMGSGKYGIYKRERKKLLEGYLKAAEKRRNWGAINKDFVIKHVRKELERF